MRVLLVSNTPFAPADAGNRARLAELLRWLAGRGAEPAALLLADWDAARWDVTAMRAMTRWVEVAHPPRASLAARVRRRLRDRPPPPGADLDVDAWCPPWFRDRVRERVAAWRPDVVLVHYVFLSACLERLPHPCLKVIDTQDVMHRRREVYRAAGLEPSWFLTTAAQERRGLDRADVALAMHDDDAAALRRLGAACEVLTVGHGRPLPDAPAAKPVAGRVLFAGSYNDLNVAGLRWFLREVWPRVRSRTDAALHVCGTVAEKLGDVPSGVTVRGAVPRLAEEMTAARVVVDPLPAGTGLQIKVIDALAHGRPVVATPPAAAGFTAGEGHGLLVAGEPAEFAAAVVRLLTGERAWRRAAAGARAAAGRFTPEAAFAPLWSRLTQGRPRSL